MEFFEVIKNRKSVRDYSEKPVEKALIEKIIDAGRLVFFELESCIEDEDVVADFDSRHVAADLFDAAERYDAHCIFRYGRDVYLRALAFARGRRGVFHLHDGVTSGTVRAERAACAASASRRSASSWLTRASRMRRSGALWALWSWLPAATVWRGRCRVHKHSSSVINRLIILIIES